MQDPIAIPTYNNQYTYFWTGICIFFLGISLSSPLHAEKKKKNIYEDEDVYLRSVYRSPEQLAAFYEGREFPHAAIKRITQSCYVTIILKNKTNDILWLELDNWVFEQKGKIIQRYDRQYWNKQWDDVKLQQSYRSTFGWTLMPEVRDLRAGEGVGGSIPIPMQTENFSLTLNFATGENKKGKIKSVKLPNIHCKQDIDEE